MTRTDPVYNMGRIIENLRNAAKSYVLVWGKPPTPKEKLNDRYSKDTTQERTIEQRWD